MMYIMSPSIDGKKNNIGKSIHHLLFLDFVAI